MRLIHLKWTDRLAFVIFSLFINSCQADTPPPTSSAAIVTPAVAATNICGALANSQIVTNYASMARPKINASANRRAELSRQVERYHSFVSAMCKEIERAFIDHPIELKNIYINQRKWLGERADVWQSERERRWAADFGSFLQKTALIATVQDFASLLDSSMRRPDFPGPAVAGKIHRAHELGSVGQGAIGDALQPFENTQFALLAGPLFLQPSLATEVDRILDEFDRLQLRHKISAASLEVLMREFGSFEFLRSIGLTSVYEKYLALSSRPST